MSDNSKIEWTDATWPITVGCTRTAPKGSTQSGCGDASGGGCYAEQSVARVNRCQAGLGKTPPYADLVKLVKRGDRMESRWTGKAQFFAERLSTPLRWKRPRRIFVSSQSDLFHHDITNEQIAAVFGVMAATPRHTYQVLTKRAKRMREWFEWISRQGIGAEVEQCIGSTDEFPAAEGMITGLHRGDWPLPNVWIGVSVENQAAADERIPELLATPAAVRWISAEPLLGPVRLDDGTRDGSGNWLRRFVRGEILGHGEECLIDRPRLDLVITGCESGSGARPCDVAWLRCLRDQCAAAGVDYFLKQSMIGPGFTVGDGTHEKAGGLLGLPYLDGVQHAAMPALPEPAR